MIYNYTLVLDGDKAYKSTDNGNTKGVELTTLPEGLSYSNGVWTMTDFSFTSFATTAIRIMSDATIAVDGTNEITAGNNSDGDSIGIHLQRAQGDSSNHTVTFRGTEGGNTDSLTVTTGTAAERGGATYGIKGERFGMDVEGIAMTVSAENSAESNSFGIFLNNDATVNLPLTVTDAELTVSTAQASGDSHQSAGLMLMRAGLSVGDNATLSITAGEGVDDAQSIGLEYVIGSADWFSVADTGTITSQAQTVGFGTTYALDATKIKVQDDAGTDLTYMMMGSIGAYGTETAGGGFEWAKSVVITSVNRSTTPTITVGKVSKLYDGASTWTLGTSEYSFANLDAGDTVGSVTVTTNSSDAGIYDTNKYTLAYTIVDADGNDVTSKYATTLTVKSDDVEITKRTITIKGDAVSKVYDGTALTGTYTVAKGATEEYRLLDGEEVTGVGFTADSTITHVGSTASKIVDTNIQIKKADGSDSSMNYNILTEDGTLTVTARGVLLQSVSANAYYDGTALQNRQVVITGFHYDANGNVVVDSEGGFLAGDGCTYDFRNDNVVIDTDGNIIAWVVSEQSDTAYGQTEVGSSKSEFDYNNFTSWKYHSYESDYTIIYGGNQESLGLGKDDQDLFGSLTVYGGPVEITPNSDGTYDVSVTTNEEGTEKVTSTVQAGQSVALFNKDTIVVIEDSSGNYDGYAIYREGVDVTDEIGNYYRISSNEESVGMVAGATGDQTVWGGPIEASAGAATTYVGPIEIEMTSYSWTYDYQAKTNGYFANGFSVTLTTSEGTQETLSYDSSAVIKLNDTDKLSVTVTGQGGSEESGKVQHVGKDKQNTVSYQVMRGSEDVTSEYTISVAEEGGKLSITPRTVVIASGDAKKVYDGEALTATSTVYEGSTGRDVGFIFGEGAAYEVTGSQTDVGTSENTIAIYKLLTDTKAADYNFVYEPGTLTVCSAEGDTSAVAVDAELASYGHERGDTVYVGNKTYAWGINAFGTAQEALEAADAGGTVVFYGAYDIDYGDVDFSSVKEKNLTIDSTDSTVTFGKLKHPSLTIARGADIAVQYASVEAGDVLTLEENSSLLMKSDEEGYTEGLYINKGGSLIIKDGAVLTLSADLGFDGGGTLSATNATITAEGEADITVCGGELELTDTTVSVANFYLDWGNWGGTLDLTGTTLAASQTVENGARGKITMDETSQISFGDGDEGWGWDNKGTVTVDMEGATAAAYKLVDNTGTQAMTSLTDFGTVAIKAGTGEDYHFDVFNNDLYACRYSQAIIVDGNYATYGAGDAIADRTGYYYGLNAASNLSEIRERDYEIVGAVSVTSNLTLATGATITIDSGASLNVLGDYELENLAKIDGEGAIYLWEGADVAAFKTQYNVADTVTVEAVNAQVATSGNTASVITADQAQVGAGETVVVGGFDISQDGISKIRFESNDDKALVIAGGDITLSASDEQDLEIVKNSTSDVIVTGEMVDHDHGYFGSAEITNRKAGGELVIASTLTLMNDAKINNSGHLEASVFAGGGTMTINNYAPEAIVGTYSGRDVIVTNEALGVLKDVTLQASGNYDGTPGTVTLTGYDDGSMSAGYFGTTQIVAGYNADMTTIYDLSKNDGSGTVVFRGVNTFTGSLTVNANSITAAEDDDNVVLNFRDVDARFGTVIQRLGGDPTFQINVSGATTLAALDGSELAIAGGGSCTLADGTVLGAGTNVAFYGPVSLQGDTSTVTIQDGARVSAWGWNKDTNIFDIPFTIGEGQTLNVLGEGTEFVAYVVDNQGTLNLSGAMTAGDMTNTGTINLTGSLITTYGLVNDGTLNWDLTGETVGTLVWDDLYNAEDGTLAITVTAEQALGEYKLATGDFTNSAGKDTFTLTGVDGAESVTVTINGDAVTYGDRTYSLSTLGNYSAADRLVLTVTEGETPSYDMTTFVVNSEWASKATGDEIVVDGTTYNYGINAFAELTEAWKSETEVTENYILVGGATQEMPSLRVLEGDTLTMKAGTSIAADVGVAIDAVSQIVMANDATISSGGVWYNLGTVTVDMADATAASYTLVDNTGTTAMTLEDYGSVELVNNTADYELAVVDNDLVVQLKESLAITIKAKNARQSDGTERTWDITAGELAEGDTLVATVVSTPVKDGLEVSSIESYKILRGVNAEDVTARYVVTTEDSTIAADPYVEHKTVARTGEAPKVLKGQTLEIGTEEAPVVVDFTAKNTTVTVNSTGTLDVNGELRGATKINVNAGTKKGEDDVTNTVADLGGVYGTTNLTAGKYTDVSADYFGGTAKMDRVTIGAEANFNGGDIDLGEGTDVLTVGADTTFAAGDLVDIETVTFGARSENTVADVEDAQKITLAAGRTVKEKVDGKTVTTIEKTTLAAGDITMLEDKANTMTLGKFSETSFGDVTFGDKNDKLAIGDESTATFDLLDFGDGKDTLTVGKNSTVKMVATTEGADSLTKFTIGRGSTAYLSSELIARGQKVTGTRSFGLGSTLVDIGSADAGIAQNFTSLEDERADNTAADAKTLTLGTFEGWISDVEDAEGVALDSDDYFTTDKALTVNVSVAKGSYSDVFIYINGERVNRETDYNLAAGDTLQIHKGRGEATTGYAIQALAAAV